MRLRGRLRCCGREAIHTDAALSYTFGVPWWGTVLQGSAYRHRALEYYHKRPVPREQGTRNKAQGTINITSGVQYREVGAQDPFPLRDHARCSATLEVG